MSEGDLFGLVGRQLEGRYQLDRVVGEGGFGVVYQGWHLAFQRPVAIKCLKTPPQFTADARQVFVAKFREEAALLYQLNERCPHVVRVLDMGVLAHPSGSVPYLALEWLHGLSLRDAVQNWRAAGLGPLTETAAVALVWPALEALASAHRGDAGAVVAHRDVKPENLFVLASGGLKLLDFGIAKVMQEGAHVTMLQGQTSSGFSAFSALYGAPEQFDPRSHGQTGPWTDVHAIALVLVELVSGRAALDTLDYASCFASAVRAERPTPWRQGVRVSDGFEAICARALALDPRQRFPDASALLAALAPWAQAGAAPALIGAPEPPRPRPVVAPAAPTAVASRLRTPATLPGDDGAAYVVSAPHAMTPGIAQTPAWSSAPGWQPPPAGYPALPGAPGGSTTGPAMLIPDARHAATAIRRESPDSKRWALAALGLSLVALVVATGLVWRQLGGSAPAASASASGSATASTSPPLASASASAWVSSMAKAGPGAVLGRLVRIEGGRREVRPRLFVKGYTSQVASFQLEETEVTVDAFRQCVEAGACSADKLNWLPGCNWQKAGRGSHPINCVSMEQADQYCRWADRRLPTEEEWEYAARGTANRMYPWGGKEPGVGVCWNGSGNSEGKGYRKGTCAVGSSVSDVTPAGVRDMAGNVTEVTASPDCDRVDEDRPACARMSCSFRTERVCLLRRVERGGHWNSYSLDTSVGGPPRSSTCQGCKGTDDSGFRCARSL